MNGTAFGVSQVCRRTLYFLQLIYKGKGAVLDGWTDPIGAHDAKVIEVEEAMLVEKDLVSQAT